MWINWRELAKIITRTGTMGKAKLNITITEKIRRRRRGGEEIRGKRALVPFVFRDIRWPNLQGHTHRWFHPNQKCHPIWSTNHYSTKLSILLLLPAFLSSSCVIGSMDIKWLHGTKRCTGTENVSDIAKQLLHLIKMFAIVKEGGGSQEEEGRTCVHVRFLGWPFLQGGEI